MSEQIEPLFSAHLECINKENLQQREVQVIEHVQDTAPDQHPNNIWVKEGRGDLGEIEELFEKIRQEEAEPFIELLLAKVGSIVRQLLSGHRFAIYQEDGDIVRDVKAILELLFGQKIDWAFRPKAFSSCILLASFLAPTACVGGSDAPSC